MIGTGFNNGPHRRVVISMLALAVAGCGSERAAIAKQGAMARGTMNVTAANGKIEAYPPAVGEHKDHYTIQVLPRGDGPPALNEVVDGYTRRFSTRGGGPADIFVRIPQGIHASLRTPKGDIHVSDVNAPVDAAAGMGNIKIQIPSYATARTGRGNVSVTFGDVNWPGTLHFESDQGDVEVWLPADANAAVDLHTDHGTVFTDFDLRGSASGQSETIVGHLGSGGNRSLVIRAKNGNVRLLKLVPQM